MRGRDGKSRGKATLGEALSPQTAGKLRQLRAQLEKKACDTVNKQLETAASYKKQRDRVAVSSPKRPPTHSNAQKPYKPTPPAPVEKTKARGYSLVKPRVTITSTKPEADRPIVSKGRAVAETAASQKDQFTWWELPLEASVRERPPTSISPADKADFERILANGGEEQVSDLPELFAVVGLDFGTSSSKVIVRFPYEAGQPTVAVPAPRHCLSEGNGYLWQTVLWLRENGEFVGWPEKDAQVLHSLKQGIMGRKASSPCVGDKYRGLTIRRIDAATAYLALVIRYVRGWLRLNCPDIFRGRHTRWLLNLGLPAEAADKGALSSVYRQVAAAALLCANYEGRVDIEATNIFLFENQVRAAARSREQALELGIGIFPETVAEAAGFAKSNMSTPDLYLMIDVGATTLDVCTFRLHRWNHGEDQYALQNGMVRPLGVEAMHWFLSEGKTEVGFRNQCERSIREVVWATRKDKDPNARCWQPGNDLPVFLVGGGAQNPLHQSVVEELSQWLRQYTQNDGIRYLEVPLPNGVNCPLPLADFGRMAVAWGLSYPEDAIGTVLPLSESKDVPPPSESNWSESFVSKEQV